MSFLTNFVTVPKAVTGEQKQDPKTEAEKLAAFKAMGHALMRMSRGAKGKNGPIKLILSLTETNIVSGANTAVASTVALAPYSVNSFTAAAALYDEYRVLGGTIRFSHQVSAAASTVPVFGVVGYDAFDATPPTSVANAMNMLYKTMFALTLTGTTPISAAKHGVWTVKFKLPKGSALDTSIAYMPSSSQWIAVQDTQNCGSMQVYIEPVPTAGIVTTRFLVSFEMEFRCRR